MQAAQGAAELSGKAALLAPATMLHLVELTLDPLCATKLLTALEAIHELGIDVGAVAHGAPEQRQLIVVLMHFRRNVSDQRPCINARVDAVQRAPNLVRLAVIERPEGAIG